MKKLLVLFLSLVLSFSVLGLVACGNTPDNTGGGENPPKEYTVEGTPGLRYSVYGQGDKRYAGFVGLTKDCTATDIVIASHYQGVKVTEIGNGMSALSNFKNVESVTIHKYINTINSSAFYNSTNLKTVNFEEDCKLDKIGGSAFKNCSKLENFNYYGKIKVLGDSAFEECTSLNTIEYEGAKYIGNIKNPYLILLTGLEVEICKVNKDCQSIHSNAFENNTTIKNIIFESDNTLTSIGGYAFKSSGLTSIDVPKTVVNIGEQAFYEADALLIVTFDKESELSVIGGRAFYQCDKLEELKNLEYTKLTEISEYMLYKSPSLKYIRIPKTVQVIKATCMWGCSSVTEITFAKDCALTEIEYHAFRACTKVQTLIIPKSVEKIGYDIIAWGNRNLKIYCEVSTQPSGYYANRWNQYKSGNTGVIYATYYYSETYKEDGWHYVNGEPTPYKEN